MFSSYRHKIDWIVYFKNSKIQNQFVSFVDDGLLIIEGSMMFLWPWICVGFSPGFLDLVAFGNQKSSFCIFGLGYRLYVNSRNQYNDLSYHPSLRSWSFGRKLFKFLCKCWVIFTWQMRLIHSLVKYGTLYTWPDVDVTEIRSAWSCQFIIVCLLL